MKKGTIKTDNIKKRLAEKHITRENLSDYLNIHLNTVNAKLNNKANFKADEIMLLSKLLDCSIDYLLGFGE